MYTKLYTTILDSSIWSSSDSTRIVWITMLAMATKNGIVHASVDGLARRANVSVAAAQAALLELEGPDPHDKSGVRGGRRIERMQGSWEIVNFEFYRETRSIDAVRKQQWRSRNVQDKRIASATVLDNAPRSAPAPAPAPEPPKPPRGPRAKRAVAPEAPMPADWAPSEAHKAYAAKHGLNLQVEADGFKGWAEGRTALSWNGTFTTRLANSVKFRGERGVPPSKPKGRTAAEALKDFK